MNVRLFNAFLLLIFASGSLSVQAQQFTEAELNKQFCASVNGQVEVSHKYDLQHRESHVRVDCETDTAVYDAESG